MSDASTTVEHLGLAVTTLAAGAGIMWGAIKARSDWKHTDVEVDQAKSAEVAELLKIKDEMIEALKEDREELKRQLAESQKRERELAVEVRELKQQLRESERETRQAITRILEAMADSERCSNAPQCANFQPPGDRRSTRGAAKPASPTAAD